MLNRYIPVIFGMLCAAGGLLIVVMTGLFLVLNKKTNRGKPDIPSHWKQTMGVITANGMEETARTRGGEPHSSQAYIEYEYEVGEQTIRKKQVISKPANIQGMGKWILMNYQSGTNVVVHFNPDEPDDALVVVN
ncbi:MAG: DUF3592 domain-containing protein [Anaerolineaceae bacterium]|nr:DUF3592 domain-containing protein [Anaerolineaceae bacterium]